MVARRFEYSEVMHGCVYQIQDVFALFGVQNEITAVKIRQ